MDLGVQRSGYRRELMFRDQIPAEDIEFILKINRGEGMD